MKIWVHKNFFLKIDAKYFLTLPEYRWFVFFNFFKRRMVEFHGSKGGETWVFPKRPVVRPSIATNRWIQREKTFVWFFRSLREFQVKNNGCANKVCFGPFEFCWSSKRLKMGSGKIFSFLTSEIASSSKSLLKTRISEWNLLWDPVNFDLSGPLDLCDHAQKNPKKIRGHSGERREYFQAILRIFSVNTSRRRPRN